MILLSNKDIEQQYSLRGETEALVWKGVVFKWARHSNGRDEYDAEGFFLGLKPGCLFENLTIVVDAKKNIYRLRTGRSLKYTKINLLGI